MASLLDSRPLRSGIVAGIGVAGILRVTRPAFVSYRDKSTGQRRLRKFGPPRFEGDREYSFSTWWSWGMLSAIFATYLSRDSSPVLPQTSRVKDVPPTVEALQATTPPGAYDRLHMRQRMANGNGEFDTNSLFSDASAPDRPKIFQNTQPPVGVTPISSIAESIRSAAESIENVLDPGGGPEPSDVPLPLDDRSSLSNTAAPSSLDCDVSTLVPPPTPPTTPMIDTPKPPTLKENAAALVAEHAPDIQLPSLSDIHVESPVILSWGEAGEIIRSRGA